MKHGPHNMLTISQREVLGRAVGAHARGQKDPLVAADAEMVFGRSLNRKVTVSNIRTACKTAGLAVGLVLRTSRVNFGGHESDNKQSTEELFAQPTLKEPKLKVSLRRGMGRETGRSRDALSEKVEAELTTMRSSVRYAGEAAVDICTVIDDIRKQHAAIARANRLVEKRLKELSVSVDTLIRLAAVLSGPGSE